MRARLHFTYIGTSLAVLLLASTASAATITLDATSRGYFTGAGTAPGINHGDPSAGYVAGEISALGSPNEDRNFFIFDLSGITDTIVSASLQISTGLYLSVDASETFSLFDVTSPLASLTNGTGGVGAFTDLGSGTTYGSRVFTAADPAVTPVTIALNAAALSNLASAAGLFGIGGAVTSISGIAEQLVFATTFFSSYKTQLVLETRPATPPAVPEPTTLILLGTGLVGTGLRRWRTRRTVA